MFCRMWHKYIILYFPNNEYLMNPQVTADSMWPQSLGLSILVYETQRKQILITLYKWMELFCFKTEFRFGKVGLEHFCAVLIRWRYQGWWCSNGNKNDIIKIKSKTSKPHSRTQNKHSSANINKAVSSATSKYRSWSVNAHPAEYLFPTLS